MTTKPISIVAMGKYLPEQVTSSLIESKHNIPSGWSEKYSGVLSRHHITHESNGYMGAKAAEMALEKANMHLGQIDMLLSASATYDYPLPNQASIIKSMLKEGNQYDFPAIDIDNTCLSFVAALDFASRMLDGNGLKNIMIVTSEISSKGLNDENWETTTLFGDAAVAAIVSYNPDSDSAFVKGAFKTYTEGVYDSLIEGGGNVKFFKDYPYDKELHSFRMNGLKLLRMAKHKIPDFMDSFFKDIPYNIEDVDAIFPHQASKTGINIFENLYKFKENQVKKSLPIYGNCIAASIPLTLHDSIENNDLQRGQSCFLCGTAAGFSIGGLLIIY